MKYTENYSLRKPEPTDYVNIADLNYNADVIDDSLKTHNHSNGNGGQIDHGSLSNLDQDTHLQYLTEDRHDTTDRHTPGTVVPVVTSIGDPGSDSNIPTEKAVRSAITSITSVTDHGALTGLDDDDHTQYLNTTRHDTPDRHTPGTVVPVTQSIPSSGGSDQIPSVAAVRDAINARIAAGSTTYDLPYWDGSKWSPHGGVFQLKSNQLSAYRTRQDTTSEVLQYLTRVDSLASSATQYNRVALFTCSTNISSDVENSGYSYGVWIQAMRNFTEGTSDAGTLAELTGALIDIGHYNRNTDSPTTTTATGLWIIPYYRTGQISTLYCIRLGSAQTGGSVTTAWGIYQENAFNNYFGGRIGIKTTPAYDLHLANDSAAKPSSNTWTVSSDRRLKTDIADADLDRCLEIVKQLPLRRFRWKDEYMPEEAARDRSKLGWIADEVETVFPKAVSIAPFVRNKMIKKTQTDETGNVHEIEEVVSETVFEDCKHMNSDQIIAAMYGAVKKLIQIVENQQKEIENLKSRLTTKEIKGV